jgi:hypothetical protein
MLDEMVGFCGRMGFEEGRFICFWWGRIKCEYWMQDDEYNSVFQMRTRWVYLYWLAEVPNFQGSASERFEDPSKVDHS